MTNRNEVQSKFDRNENIILASLAPVQNLDTRILKIRPPSQNFQRLPQFQGWGQVLTPKRGQTEKFFQDPQFWPKRSVHCNFQENLFFDDPFQSQVVKSLVLTAITTSLALKKLLFFSRDSLDFMRIVPISWSTTFALFRLHQIVLSD